MTAALYKIGRTVSLEDRYELTSGRVLLSGIQALVRLTLDQMRADRDAGLRTAAFVSGYQGSPLGGLDLEFGRARELCGRLAVRHHPALNEELGATSVWGTQLAANLPGSNVDGVLGIWYGKAPGVDRAADALRHGNHVGAHPKGGWLAICGDDPWCKSSTLPSASEGLLASLRMPTFYPGNPQEILELGRHAIALSRSAGVGAALKIVTNVADATGTVDLDAAADVQIVASANQHPHQPSADLLPPGSVRLDESLLGRRMTAVQEYLLANELNRTVVDPPAARTGMVSAGATYFELREALHTLGLDERALHEAGVRLLKLDVLWPLAPSTVRKFAEGLDHVLVLEEKGPFIETELKAALYGSATAPSIAGQHGLDGKSLVSPSGGVDTDRIIEILARWGQCGKLATAARNRLAMRRSEVIPLHLPVLQRTPYFCSGCPHNRSTAVPEGALVGAGIGCHGMVTLLEAGKGQILGLTQMGGEGAQWIGQAPYTESSHIFQNLGDGTFNHSGSLAIRAAVAAGVNITYKLLYNEVAAMTGGQEIKAAMSVLDLARWLLIEGVNRVVVTTDDMGKYRGRRLPAHVSVRPRIELDDVQRTLSAVEGVSALIYDQGCAAEKRRLRRRGKLAEPTAAVAINQRVCEGCGDCGRKSHCLSLLPVETGYGRKTRIQQSSCNDDASCVEGDCPSFIRVTPGRKSRRTPPLAPPDLPSPTMVVGPEATIRLMGIGGTGVTTAAQLLAMAALLDGKRVLALNQTGLAQKGGAVVSDVRILEDALPRSSRAADRTADAYIGFDIVGAVAPGNLRSADVDKTVAVISTTGIPTGEMIGDPHANFPDLGRSVETINRATRSDHNVYLDAVHLCEELFGDHMAANSLLLGAAWQAGALPVTLEAMEEAFRLNGVSVEQNILAFIWGRAAVARPEMLADEADAGEPVLAGAAARELAELNGITPELAVYDLACARVDELMTYQGRSYAEDYARFVATTARAAPQEAPGVVEVTRTVAHQLFRLMAYKDEYEVARLHLDPAENLRLADEFGEGFTTTILLHPPVLRAVGVKRKIEFGPRSRWLLRVLRSLKGLRGTPFDLFGYAKVRRVERSLIHEYKAHVLAALPRLTTAPALVLELCAAADTIKGYEEVKLANVDAYRAAARNLLEQLNRDRQPPDSTTAPTATGGPIR